MTNRTIAAMFDRYEDAADAVRRLEGAGIAHGDISIVSNDASHNKYHDANRSVILIMSAAREPAPQSALFWVVGLGCSLD